MISPSQIFTGLLDFENSNGANPKYGRLIQGKDGNIYGTTQFGGASSCNLGCGTVFRMMPDGSLTILHAFVGMDGAAPGGLLQATDGNLYGATQAGGTDQADCVNGCGTVFRIATSGAFTVLYNFTGAASQRPFAALIQASDGNLYGTASAALTPYCGSVFRISLSGVFTTVHTFNCDDGSEPRGALVQAKDGNFYGTTAQGGSAGMGTIFQLTPDGKVTTLQTFGSDSGLIQGSDGNFYGSAPGGGFGLGWIFQMTPAGVLTPLHSFGVAGCFKTACSPDGAIPYQLVEATDGNLYGVTSFGGSNDYGTVFQIAKNGNLTTLHQFSGTDGEQPFAGLLQAADGLLYGTTCLGGPDHFGSIFKLTLPGVQDLPQIQQSGGVVSSASFQPGIAFGSWISIVGTNLSSQIDTWTVIGGKLPTSLDGVKVDVSGQPAYVAYVSPTLINALAPNVGDGLVSVTVTNSAGTSPAVTVGSRQVQPAFFQWGSYAVATRQDYSLAAKNGTISGTTTTPAKPGDTIVLWGTGFGPTMVIPPVGFAVPSSTSFTTANPVSVRIGGTPVPVFGAALTPGTAGLYQVAVQIPTSLADGDYEVVAEISGSASPSGILITVQK